MNGQIELHKKWQTESNNVDEIFAKCMTEMANNFQQFANGLQGQGLMQFAAKGIGDTTVAYVQQLRKAIEPYLAKEENKKEAKDKEGK